MTTVTIARVVSVGLAEAWRAWTDPARLAQWWWPGLPDTTFDWSPSVGASYLIESRAAGLRVRGAFTEVDEPRRISCTWTWVSTEPGPTPEELVEITFEPDGDSRTRVTVRHTSPQSLDEMSGLLEGWHAVMDRLAALEPATS